MKYNDLTVIDEKKINGIKWVTCKCKCGTIKDFRWCNVKSGNTKSCGCRNHRIGKDSPFFTGCGDVGSFYFNRIKRNAIQRRIEFSITIEYADELFQKQKHKCALSGIDLRILNRRGNRNECTASLDRIDNSRGYVEGNLQWVHKDINKMKTDMDQDTFLDLCRKVAEWQT